MESIKRWYSERIVRGELTLDGWSREYSQKLRWEVNLRMMEALLETSKKDLPLSVVDFGCGTGGFYHFLVERGVPIAKYYGIEIREDALHVLKSTAARLKIGNVITAFGSAPAEFTDFTDVAVCNAAFGFEQQNPIYDLKSVVNAFKPSVLIADFFSNLRPYEPGIDGYLAFNPCLLLMQFCTLFETKRFILDHSSMPHAFTIGLGFAPTPWEVEEARGAHQSVQ